MGFSRPPFEVADVIRMHGPEFLRTHPSSLRQRQILFRLAACRTASMGGHVEICPSCQDVQRISYNSCRDRHCPKCQGRERARWVEASLARILPVPHFHLVFTLPHLFHPLFLAYPRRLYHLLFQTCAQTLLDFSADPRHLGALPGFILVLHTWAQDLSLHPHLHAIVTSGGFDIPRHRWLPANPTFLFPVKALAQRFRHLFRTHLLHLLASGRLGTWDPESLASFHHALQQKRWVVYAKRPFHGPEPLFRYLGHYTHRIGFSNHRLRSVSPESVVFSARSRQPATGQRRVLLSGPEFLRRFLLHVLPKGFVRIRHFGLYSTTHQASHLAHARHLLAPLTPPKVLTTPASPPPPTCPSCGRPLLRLRLPDTLRPAPTHLSRSPPHAA